MSLATTCPVCEGVDLRPVFALRDVPVICNQLYTTAEEAKAAPAGDVDLVRCNDCAMIWNRAFEPEKMVYAPGYENALHFSPKFQKYAEDLAADLVGRHGLSGKDVVEIGCGDGHMLDLMSQNGAATAVGFDPSMEGKETPFTARDGVEITPEYFQSDQLDRPFDIVMCRHVLEHLYTPMPLLADVRRAAASRGAPVYFETPNAWWMLDAVSMWDVIYEHVGYWTGPSMEAAFRRAGFAPSRVETAYGDQFLMIEAAAAAPEAWTSPEAPAVAASADAFGAASNAELEKWRGRLSDGSSKAVIWGAGSKGITFANALGAPANASLAALVDLNPRKHGLFAPTIGLPVIGPADLVALQPSLVLISNGLYETEITRDVRALGLDPEFAVIAG